MDNIPNNNPNNFQSNTLNNNQQNNMNNNNQQNMYSNQQNMYNNQPNMQTNMHNDGQQNSTNIPMNLKPLSPWAYLGYCLLFNIPFIGFILLLVFSFDDSNINRKNYARSFFCMLLITVIILVIILIFGLGTSILYRTKSIIDSGI